MRIFWTLIALGAAVLSATTSSATIISVRLIKTKPSRCTSTPRLEFLSPSSSYQLVQKEWYNGENDWEIFFEIETANPVFPKEDLSILAGDVEIARAIVGRTDVPYTRHGDRYQFTLVNDTADGRHVQTSWQDPRGGPHM